MMENKKTTYFLTQFFFDFLELEAYPLNESYTYFPMAAKKIARMMTVLIRSKSILLD